MCRGVVFRTQDPSNIGVSSTTTYGANYGAHSPPNYLSPQNQAGSSIAITLQDSSGAEFGLKSFWLDGFPPLSGTCTERITISTSGGGANPACSKTPSNIASTSRPVQIVFDPPCLADTVIVTANNVPGCYGETDNAALSLGYHRLSHLYHKQYLLSNHSGHVISGHSSCLLSDCDREP